MSILSTEKSKAQSKSVNRIRIQGHMSLVTKTYAYYTTFLPKGETDHRNILFVQQF